MGRHTRSIPIVKPDHERVIYLLAKQIDAMRCEQLVGYVRTETEAQKDIQEIIDDAWAEVRANE